MLHHRRTSHSLNSSNRGYIGDYAIIQGTAIGVIKGILGLQRLLNFSAFSGGSSILIFTAARFDELLLKVAAPAGVDPVGFRGPKP